MHTHVFVGSRPGTLRTSIYSVSPDDFSSGQVLQLLWMREHRDGRNFALFKEQVIDKSQTRILAFSQHFWSRPHQLARQ
jgi:dihydroorotase